VLGNGVRFKVVNADFPARILLFVNPDYAGSATFSDTQLQSIVTKAGHRLDTAKSREELATKLKTRIYDLVLADFSDASSLEELVQAAPSQPLLLPWVYQPTQAEKSRAEKQYQLVLKAPVKVSNFLSTIDRTMERKAKMARTAGSKQASLLR
jgi:DNA-binding NtrC family response regulator